MANSAHNIYSLVTQTGYRATGAAPAAARAGFALVADRTVPVMAVPAAYDLVASRAAPKTAAPPPGYALSAGRRAVDRLGQSWRATWGAFAAAFTLHFALPVMLALLAYFSASPALHKQLGMEDGVRDTFEVSFVNAPETKRFSDPLLQEASPPPAMAMPAPPQEPQPPAPAPEQPPAPAHEASAPPSPAQAKASEKREAAYDPSGFAAFAANQFSGQIDYAFKAAEARARQQAAQRPPPLPSMQNAALAARNVRVMRPGATHVGKSDEFERAVIWALGATRPMGNGKYGSTVVTFIVTGPGDASGLKMLKGSGDNWLDNAALMAVRQARMPDPPPGLPAGDRTFVIQYISLPSR